MSTESNEPVEPEVTTAPEDDDEAPAKKNWAKFVIVGVLAVVLVGGAVWAFNMTGSGWGVGDCASVKLTSEGKSEASAQSCSSDDGAYKVAKVLNSDQETCPEEGLYETAPWDSKQLCLMPNFEEGKCFVPNDEGLFKKGACSGDGYVKVVKKVDGKPDVSQSSPCPEGSDGMQFTEPEVLYCLGAGDTP